MLFSYFVGAFRIKITLEIILSISVLLVHDIQSDEVLKNQDKRIKIIQEGNDVIAECPYCNVDSLLWTYKPPNGTQSDIVTGREVIRKNSQTENELWFNISIDDTTCTYILLIPSIQMEKAGIYSCWEGSNETKTYIIVINENNKCSIEPELSDHKNILLKQNESVTIKCSFQYSADESCVVTPIWTDLTGHRDLTIPGDDFEVDMDDKHAWIHFKPGADVANGTHFNLSFAFNCSSSQNYSQVKLCGNFDFGKVPFILFAEAKKEGITGPDSRINRLLTIGVTMATIIVAVFLFLIFIWKLYKFISAADIDDSVVGKALPDIPVVMEHTGVMKDLQYRDIDGYKSSEDAAYDVIKD